MLRRYCPAHCVIGPLTLNGTFWLELTLRARGWEIDERLDEPLLARSTKWMDLGPRSGLSDAQRMLRWLRLNPGGVDDVLKRALASRPSPIPRPNLSRQQVKTSQKRRAIEAAKHDARAEGRALSFTVREDARMLSR